MEEILASIRRIIESNEPGAENALPHSMSPAYDEEADEAEDGNFGPDVAANDRGMPARNETLSGASVPPSQTAQPERSLSLADVAARVRAASARQPEPGNLRLATASAAPASGARQEEPAPLRSQMPRVAEMPHMPELREPPAVRPAPSVRPTAPQPEPLQRATPPAFEPPRPVAASMEVPTRPEPKPAAVPGPQSLPAKIEETANLLSVEAGAQVAKSFGELAAVFNGIERRSLEEMAQDMLRPMLQEWLDDNLPTLVERLVREEIERVARGPRR